MLKRMVCLTGLLGALFAFVYQSAAQNYTAAPAKATIQEYGPFRNPQFKNTQPKSNANGLCGIPAVSCAFYGGDFFFSPLQPLLPNGLSNENDLVISGTPYGAAVWVPFTVPAGKGWQVTGLFSNNQADFGVLDQSPNTPASAAYYSVNQGTTAGNPGAVVASGIGAATSALTGRSAFGLAEFTVQVSGLSFQLAPGDYWMAVVPLCTNTQNPFCFGRFFLSDVEYINLLPASAQGPPEPIDASFFDSSNFGFAFQPTYGFSGVCGGFGCDAFSAGVVGRAAK